MDDYANLRNTSSPYADGKMNPDDLERPSDYTMGSPAGYWANPPTAAAGNPHSGGAGTFSADEQQMANGIATALTEDADVYARSISSDTPPTSAEYFADQGQTPQNR